VVGVVALDLLRDGSKIYQVGVGADGDSAFARVEAEEFCGGGNELDETMAKNVCRGLRRSRQGLSGARCGTTVGNLVTSVLPSSLSFMQNGQ